MKSFASRRGLQFGEFTVKEDVPVYRPNRKGDTRVVVYPSFNEDGAEPTLIRGEPSEAFVELSVAEYVGGRGFHMLVQDTESTPHPYQIFYDAINNKVDSDPKNAPDDWFRWLGKKVGGEKRASKAILTRIKKVVAFQGILLEQSGKELEKPRKHIMFIIPPSAKKEFEEGLCEGAEFESITEGRELIIEATEVERNGRNQTSYVPKAGKKYKMDLKEAEKYWMPWEEILNLNESPGVIIRRLLEGFDTNSVVYAFKDSVYASYLDDNMLSQAGEIPEESENFQEEEEEDVPDDLKSVPPPKKSRKKKEEVVYEDEDDKEHLVDASNDEEEEEDTDTTPDKDSLEGLEPPEEDLEAFEAEDDDEEVALQKQIEELQKAKKSLKKRSSK